jgi:hypothetical protein
MQISITALAASSLSLTGSSTFSPPTVQDMQERLGLRYADLADVIGVHSRMKSQATS